MRGQEVRFGKETGHILFGSKPVGPNDEVIVSFGHGDVRSLPLSQLTLIKYIKKAALLDHLIERMSKLQAENKWDRSLETGLIIGEINSGKYDVLQKEG